MYQIKGLNQKKQLNITPKFLKNHGYSPFCDAWSHMSTHTRHKDFACQVCYARFALSCNLKQHMLTHSGQKLFVKNVIIDVLKLVN